MQYMVSFSLEILFPIINDYITVSNRGVTVFQQGQITAIKDWALSNLHFLAEWSHGSSVKC